VNINKLLKDFPRLLERVEALERQIRQAATAAPPVSAKLAVTHSWAPVVDTGTQVPVTLAPAVSERSPAVNRERSFGEEKTRNRRGSTRRN
jgi:hypothetical protein